MTLEEKLESGEIKIIDSKALDRLLNEARQNLRKGILKASEAKYILSMSEDSFRANLKDPKSLIRPSSMKGKYVASSVYDELERLNS